MSSDELVKSTLEKLGIPVERLRLKGKPDRFITFQRILSRDTDFSDNDAGAKEHLFRAHIYSKTDYINLLEQLEDELKSAEFYGISVKAEIYEDDTGYYHVPVEFHYME